MKRVGMLLVALMALLIPGSVFAASGEAINRYYVDVQLQPDGSAIISETITYDFGEAERHGIYRIIPTRYKSVSDTSLAYQLDYSVLDVARSGVANEPYSVSKNGNGDVEVKIGNPSVTISGEQTYTVTYGLSSLVLPEDGRDVLRLDVLPDAWDVPVSGFAGTLELPFQAMSTECFTGSFQSTEQDCQIVSDTAGTTLTYATAAMLGNGEGMTVQVEFPSGSFTDYPEAVPLRELQLPGFVLFLVAAPIAFVLEVTLFSWLRGRWRKGMETVVVQYESPSSLKPAEVGALIDNASGSREVAATIVHAARQGFLQIELVKEAKWYRGAEISLHKKKEFDALPEPEATLLSSLFGGKKTLKLNKPDTSGKRAKAVQKFLKATRQNLDDGGYYGDVFSHFKLPNMRSWWTVQGGILLAIAAGGGYLWLNDQQWYAYILFGMVAGMSLGLLIPSLRNRMSKSGYSRWAEVEGFRQFLSVSEKERLAFHDAPKRSPKQFSEFLPYAIALGVEDAWAKQFKDVDVSKDQDWYIGPQNYAFTAAILSNQMSKSLVSVTTSSLMSSGGSHSAGGSFSGGGVGGGGGGSW